QTALQKFQRNYPDWNTQVVKFRLNYLEGKSGVRANVPAAPPAGAPRTVSPAVPPPANQTTPPAPRPAAAPPVTTNNPAAPTTPGRVPAQVTPESQISNLKDQVRQLEADKLILQAKLKEALGVQPAASDPRELAKAQETIKSLQKENDLLKVSLSQQKAKAASPTPSKAPEQSADARNVAASNAALEQTKKALDEANRRLAEQSQLAAKLAVEKQALQAKLNNPKAQTDAALFAENHLHKKQLADLKAAPSVRGKPGDLARQLAAAQTQIASLQSDKEVLRLEKTVMENRLKQLTGQATSTAVAAAPAK